MEPTADMSSKTLKAALAAVALIVGLAGTAQAQSSSGNITGNGIAGETIIVNGADNGFHREMTLKDDGKFTIRRVPTGTYTVVRMAPDGSAGTAQTLVIQVGGTARVQ